MNTLELLSSLEGCKIVKREDLVIEIIPEVETCEFKKGGFVYHSEIRGIEKYEWVAIVDYIYGARIFDVCNMLINTGGLSMQEDTPTAFCKSKQARPATHEEKQLLIDTLHKKRKIWNSETLQIEEDRAPRVGDLVVVWAENNPKNVTVGRLKKLLTECVRIEDHPSLFNNCVKFENFNFETMAPKHEK